MDEVIKKINESLNIGITYHVSPDGDALGSALALLMGLKKYGKNAYIISKDIVSDDMGYLPCSSEVNGFQVTPKEDTDLVIVVDCGNLERISADLGDYSGTIINIDHHLSNDEYGTINYIDVNAAATAEIIYYLLKTMNIIINKDIATCLYTSLVTDTGSFKFSNVTKRTHEIAGELIELGIDNSSIHSEIFDNKPLNSLKILGEILKGIKVFFDGKVSYLELTKEICDESTDVSDVVNFGLKIKGVEVAVFIKEIKDGVKVSLRSKHEFDVRKIAEVFGGGGHTKASGITFRNKTIQDVKELILTSIENELV
ncbi:bifunctional oligoribonuclease/PAP phosphatase NrnA [Clostridium sp. YIM B02551]|uniref:DHH family phosphoesterase n=1 Tax=Clostridium sp. YIM B02551 TaxID=2910679 RepID=UPI001EEA4C74|nr:bifunctional oligoribonuclease/PAP phosphatase NrnA [Clostridium sp. YIM B02551]